MYVAKLTNKRWTRYFDSLSELTKALYTAECSCAAKIFSNGKHIGYYGTDGGIIPRAEVNNATDERLMRIFWPFSSVDKLHSVL